MIIYISETIGTFIFVFLTLAIVANTVSSSESNNTTLFVTSFGIGLAYILPCILFGDVSGAHFNPAITIATSLLGIFEKRFMWGYVISQSVGAFAASLLYTIFFCNKLKVCNNQISKLKLFSVSPNGNFLINFLKEVFASFLFLLGMLGVTFVLKGVTTESVYILYFLVIVAIGLAFDYTSVAINPFRDIFTRLYYLIIPFKDKGKLRFYNILITIIGPIVGAYLAVKFFQVMPWT